MCLVIRSDWTNLECSFVRVNPRTKPATGIYEQTGLHLYAVRLRGPTTLLGGMERLTAYHRSCHACTVQEAKRELHQATPPKTQNAILS